MVVCGFGVAGCLPLVLISVDYLPQVCGLPVAGFGVWFAIVGLLACSVVGCWRICFGGVCFVFWLFCNLVLVGCLHLRLLHCCFTGLLVMVFDLWVIVGWLLARCSGVDLLGVHCVWRHVLSCLRVGMVWWFEFDCCWRLVCFLVLFAVGGG